VTLHEPNKQPVVIEPGQRYYYWHVVSIQYLLGSNLTIEAIMEECEFIARRRFRRETGCTQEIRTTSDWTYSTPDEGTITITTIIRTT